MRFEDLTLTWYAVLARLPFKHARIYKIKIGRGDMLQQTSSIYILLEERNEDKRSVFNTIIASIADIHVVLHINKT